MSPCISPTEHVWDIIGKRERWRQIPSAAVARLGQSLQSEWADVNNSSSRTGTGAAIWVGKTPSNCHWVIVSNHATNINECLTDRDGVTPYWSSHLKRSFCDNTPVVVPDCLYPNNAPPTCPVDCPVTPSLSRLLSTPYHHSIPLRISASTCYFRKAPVFWTVWNELSLVWVESNQIWPDLK